MTREYKFGRQVFKLNLKSEADESVFSEIFLDRDYMVVDDIVSEASSAILDIGAHIGLFSMYARGLNDNVKIFAYEPAPENFATMKVHFKENHITGVTPKNVAVTAKDGETVLFLSEDSHNHSIWNLFGTKMKQIKVPTVSMEKIFERDFVKQGVNFCDLVKMDCEGAEFEILGSMSSELFKKIGSFYIEYHEYLDDKRHEELVKILQKNGFKVRVTKSRYDNKLGFIFAYR
ncbi:MAG: FkbM family methyltransferase [Candidatus Gracilibacteria bacterium]